jgi:peroxidase
LLSRHAEDNIAVPPFDPQWDSAGNGGVFMPYHRSSVMFVPSTSGATRTGRWRQLINMVTPSLDLHTVYGVNDVRRSDVRDLMSNGTLDYLLSTSAVDPMVEGGVPEVGLPRSFTHGAMLNPTARPPAAMFLAGDDRANMHPGLLCLHTVFVLEHNRKAKQIAASPDLVVRLHKLMRSVDASATESDAIFRAAQVHTRAVYQKIVWYEYLPLLLGKAEYSRLAPYDRFHLGTDPSISVEYATGAMVFWLSMLNSKIPRLGPSWEALPGGALSLRDAWFAPHRVSVESGIIPILRGAWLQEAQAADLLIVEEARNGFLGANAQGLDLAAIFLQRGRDAGVQDYITVRRLLLDSNFSAPDFESFVSVSGLPSKVARKLAAKLRDLYANVSNVDLLIGGLLESPVEGGVVGPTFARILREQFERTRAADPDWFENLGNPYQPLLAALGTSELKDVTFAHVLGRTVGVTAPRNSLGAEPASQVRMTALGLTESLTLLADSSSAFYAAPNNRHMLSS